MSDEHLLDPERYELSESRRYWFELERREFLRLFGGGLLVITTVADGLAQESGRDSGRSRANLPPEVGAWLHIDESGHATVYTGKVEIGQNARTSLAQTVADELRVPFASVTLVMGDTDLTPFDSGTYGSQTTPRMAPQLARAAATAREMLIDEAASRWQVDRSTLRVQEGRVVSREGRTATYGELTKGQKLGGVISDNAAVSASDRWTTRGTAVRKANGRAFVTGQHQYSPDIVRPGMMYGRIVRPEAMNATLTSVDDTQARAMTGVTVVRDGNFLGVVATREVLASRGAAAVRTAWKVPADQPSSETVYEYFKRNPAPNTGGRGGRLLHVEGDIAIARAGAARTFESRYTIPYIAHVPLEPRAAVAEWQDGKLTVWTGTQRPFGVRSELAEAFRLPDDRVRVIVPDTGSAYGGKHTGEQAIEAARLAKAVGKPVKVVWTREEEFAWGYVRPAGVIEIRSAVDRDGRLVAWEFDNWNSGGAAIRTPYAVSNQRIAFHPSQSPLRQGSYRGLAATANHFAREMHVDEVARALKRDAVEFRLFNLEDRRLRAVLTAAAEKGDWSRAPGRDRTLGIACGTEKGSYVATLAEVSRAAASPSQSIQDLPVGYRVERLVVVFECGAIVNPDGLRNQVEGAVVQGLGGALFEAIRFADGKLLNGSLGQYRVPRFKDVPPIEILLLDRPDLPSAGAGETPIVCVAPAIGAAVRTLGAVAPAMPVRLQV